ncbi:Flavin containing amine oxidoreductase [Geosmithia morbida]|uniref:Flavin containing amine oxidoreductase n=1 Tax=Geosmithia morbida TaxID=1094350 RepID=A0A9P4YWD1_9HYPO|nr:Flavin containing amine oxidoreductase [Geosmithia morbida]KAF4122893.1 Flavin containing amine oxidoreductase [Geosmithia morbida]
MVKYILAVSLWATASLATAGRSTLPIGLETRTELGSRLANVHVSRRQPVNGTVTYTYGSCNSNSQPEAHHTIAQSDDADASRLVWIIPEEATEDGCIAAWSDSGKLVGRSRPQRLQSESIAMNNASGIDASGPWFDGVALLKNKEPIPVNVAKAKKKDIGIVGAGMSGLMTFLVLHQAGLENIHIVEAGNRLGGRVHTEYLSGGPFDYSYQEMGPMRFPHTWINPETNKSHDINDQKLVFSLADEMNRINKHDRNLSVDFIEWIQTNENGLYYYDEFKLPTNLPPTQAQVAANSSLAETSVLDASTEKLQAEVDSIIPGPEFLQQIAANIFKAHKSWVDSGLGGLGGDQWSEFAFMVNHLHASLNSTDQLGATAVGWWDDLYEGLYFDSSTWKTIDGGLNRLPLSFHPLVDPVTTLERKIERVRFETNDSVTLQWRHNYTDSEFQNSTYDYVVVSAPFSAVRQWRLPHLPATITNAIANLPYSPACKVALEYSERFWEHYENPIHGSCSTVTDIPLIGSICYPSYNLNATGPASILGSYISGDTIASTLSSMSEAEHVQYVLDAMSEIHGEHTRELYTGNYNRRCWNLDPLEMAGWVSPTIGQHQLYIPEYFKTYNNMIFVGEHTSYTHAWIASALESGIRGSIQLLLELGLVDEAKAANEKWMGRFIQVVC